MIILFLVFPKTEAAFIAAFACIVLLLILIFIPKYKETILDEISGRILFTFVPLFLFSGIVRNSPVTTLIKDRLSFLPPWLAVIIFMWGVGIFTSILSAGPSTLTFIQFADTINQYLPGKLAFWALSLGVLPGSSASTLGATAGPVAAGIYEKIHGPFSLTRFWKIGYPIMFFYLILSSIYVLLRLFIKF